MVLTDRSRQPLIVAASISSAIILRSPPPALSIFAVDLYLDQAVELQSRRSDKREIASFPRRPVLHAGATATEYGKAGFADRARREGKLLRDAKSAPGSEEWRWSSIDRLVSDDLAHSRLKLQLTRIAQPHVGHLQPTTQLGTRTVARFSSVLVFQLIVSLHDSSGRDGPIKVLTLFKKEIDIAS